MSEPENRPKISDRPQVTFKGPTGKYEVEAKADTAADRTAIDIMVAKKIGAGPILKVVQVNDEDRRPVVPVTLEVGGLTLSTTASISDRRGVNYREEGRKREVDAILGDGVVEYVGIYADWDPDSNSQEGRNDIARCTVSKLAQTFHNSVTTAQNSHFH